MSNTVNAPFGFQPIYHASGSVRPQAFTLLNNCSSTLLANQPVKIDTDGTLVPAAVADAIIGAFQGVEFTDQDGRRRVSNKWIGGNTGTDITAYATSDPYIVYQIQSNAAINITNIGNQFDFANITAGSTTVGISQATLDVASATTSGSNTLRLVGITPGPDNNWGDTYVICQVEISDHQFVATRNAF
jgi:hypothetical protein